MEKSEIEKILIETTNDYFESQDFNEKANKDTVLFGRESVLDSMGLVNVIIDIESKFLDEGYEISLTSEKAMSRRQSPFRTISTLADFIEEQITSKERNDE
jgi:acyl carrier protein